MSVDNRMKMSGDGIKKKNGGSKKIRLRMLMNMMMMIARGLSFKYYFLCFISTDLPLASCKKDKILHNLIFNVLDIELCYHSFLL